MFKPIYFGQISVDDYSYLITNLYVFGLIYCFAFKHCNFWISILIFLEQNNLNLCLTSHYYIRYVRITLTNCDFKKLRWITYPDHWKNEIDFRSSKNSLSNSTSLLSIIPHFNKPSAIQSLINSPLQKI
jgi:hypothetical protein